MYADSAELDADAINLEALETLVQVAGMAVDLLASRSAPATGYPLRPNRPRKLRLQKRAAEEVSEFAPPAYVPVAEYDEITPVVEESAPAPEPIAEYQVEAEPVTEVEPEAPVAPYEAAVETQVETPAEVPVETPAEVPFETRAEVPANSELPQKFQSEAQAEPHIESPASSSRTSRAASSR